MSRNSQTHFKNLAAFESAKSKHYFLSVDWMILVVDFLRFIKKIFISFFQNDTSQLDKLYNSLSIKFLDFLNPISKLFYQIYFLPVTTIKGK